MLMSTLMVNLHCSLLPLYHRRRIFKISHILLCLLVDSDEMRKQLEKERRFKENYRNELRSAVDEKGRRKLAEAAET